MGIRFCAVLLISGYACAAQARECVILLPGIAMPWLTMSVLEYRLESDGYTVWNCPIRTTDRSVNAAALQIDRGVADCKSRDATPIHFVTHSMGALLLRAYFQNREKGEFGRVVMLGPPNHGSDLVDRLSKYFWFRWFYGPAGLEMRTGEDGIASKFEPVVVEVGVVAALHDNKVSLASTRLDEMTDHVVVDGSHTGLPYSREVYTHIHSFLQTGHFSWISEMAPPAALQ